LPNLRLNQEEFTLQKNVVFLIIFLVGLSFLVYSWYTSYPLLIESGNDYIFYHVHWLYWPSVILLMGSMFLMALFTKNNILKWLLSIGIVLTIYSIFFFYQSTPTSDSQYFRGLNEYFFETKSLAPNQLDHLYYEWPSFFVLSFIGTHLPGLSLIVFEYVIFILIGVFLCAGLYVYFSKRYEKGAFFGIVAFFITLFYFMNFQAVPFSLAFGIFFLILMLETSPKTNTIVAIILFLYISLVITHSFVPLFFVIYLLSRTVLDKSRSYGYLFVFSVASYFIVQLTLARFSFEQAIVKILSPPKEYANIAETTLAPVTNPIDIVAQLFSRVVVVSFALICLIGFFYLFRKKKITNFEKAVLFTGLAYTVLGFGLNLLGWRAIAIILIPISLGVAYLFQSSKYKKYLKIFSFILVLFFFFVPLHQQTFSDQVHFQSESAHTAENFFIKNHDWSEKSQIISGFRVANYIIAKLDAYLYIYTDLEEVNRADSIVFTEELARDLVARNMTMDGLIQDQGFNVLYSNGLSSLLVRPGQK
jgi:hypothetical protein